MGRRTGLILVVDDDHDFLEITRGIVEAGGYRVACADDPETAWEMMLKETPDLVITDLMMQATGAGFSFSRRIKETPDWQAVPVIIMTAVGSRLGYDFVPRRPEDLAAMRADAFMEKPVSPEELLARISHLLEDGDKEQEA